MATTWYRYARTGADWLFSRQKFGGEFVPALKTGRIMFWDAAVSGVKYPELIDFVGNHVDSLPADQDGYFPQEWWGPAPYMWADGGTGARILVLSMDLLLDAGAQAVAAAQSADEAEAAAASIQPGVPGGVATLDLAGLLPEGQVPERLSETGLGAQFAAKAGRADLSALDALAPLSRSLANTDRSCAVQVLGDSTGNDLADWPNLLLDDLAVEHPAWTVRRLTWDDPTQRYTRTTTQTGTDGVLYQACDGVKDQRGTPSVYLSGVIDVRAKVLPTAGWVPGSNMIMVGQMGAADRSWALCLKDTGTLQLMYSTDGSGIALMGAQALLGATDGVEQWVRCVFTPDDGAGNRVAEFYQSTDDGATWTQVGPTVTQVGPVVLNDGASSDPRFGFYLGGFPVGAYGRWVGNIYEVEIRDGEDGPTVAPTLPDLWPGVGVDAAPVVGAPVLTLVNGSDPGADIAYLGDATRLPKMTPDHGQVAVLLSDSHNEQFATGAYWLDLYAGWLADVTARLANTPALILTQNPQRAAMVRAPDHAQRRLDLLRYAAANRLGVVDTYKAFLDYGNWQTDLMQDDVHPNPAGSQLWADTIKAVLDAS